MEYNEIKEKANQICGRVKTLEEVNQTIGCKFKTFDEIEEMFWG